MERQHQMQADARQQRVERPDPRPLLGKWTNTLADTEHIRHVDVRDRDGRLMVRPWGAGFPGVIDWGEAEGHLYHASGTGKANGFRAEFDLGSSRVSLACNCKLGVLVVICYVAFQDGSGRADYCTREFFHR